jgi:hypothetical protein
VKVSTRPLMSVTTPASVFTPVSDPVLARNQPAEVWFWRTKRYESVPLPPAMGSTSSSGRSFG